MTLVFDTGFSTWFQILPYVLKETFFVVSNVISTVVAWSHAIKLGTRR